MATIAANHKFPINNFMIHFLAGHNFGQLLFDSNIPAQMDFKAQFRQHGRFDAAGAMGLLLVWRVNHLDVVDLCRAIIWSRVTPSSTACMIGHCGGVELFPKLIANFNELFHHIT
jgi:hypothetical protein